MKKLIKNYSLEEITEYFTSIGEKSYRARQLFSWIYDRNIETFNEMTNFSKELREKLSLEFELSPLTLEEKLVSDIDQTEKFLFKTIDNKYIETVLIKNDGTEDGRLTVCVSSQVGCAMGCVFCSTAKLGFIRNLEPAEILDQLNQIRRVSGLRNNNIVFMGMGEPFMNYENVLKAADIMNYSFGFHISVRKITISTCGVLPQIERFIDEKRMYNLALSLNDTDFTKRAANMPIEKKYPFEKIALLLKKKFPVSRNRLTIEYVMRKDNISKIDAEKIKKLFKFGRIKLNLIPLNLLDSESLDMLRPTDEEMSLFIKDLEIMNVPVSVRKSMGEDIGGACGQLSGRRHR
jgi:23S rRNA (adenine2503-C2)-methyltransferase